MKVFKDFFERAHLGSQSPWVMLISVVALSSGGISLISPETEGMVWFSIAVLAMVGVAGLFRLVTVSGFATPWSVMAVAFSLGYGLGSFNTFISGYSQGMDLISVTYATDRYLTMASGGILMLCGVLLICGELDGGKLLPNVMLDEAETRTIVFVMALTAVLALVAVATGQLGFQADMKTEEGSNRVSVIGNLLASSMPPMVATGLYAAQKMKHRSRYLVYVFAAILMLVLMTQGRRIFMYTAVTVAIGYFGAQGVSQFFRPRNLLILVVGGLTIMLASKMFFAMRQATYDNPQGAPLVELVAAGWSKMTQGDIDSLNDKLDENRATRTFILGYVGELLTGLDGHEPMGGDIMILGLASSVPTVIWPGKWKIMALGSDEAICHPVLGLPAWDAANSLVTSGICDFGWFGFFAYPLLFALIFSLMILVVRNMSAVVRLMFGFSLIYALLSVEAVIASYLVTVRNLTMVVVFMLLVHWMVSMWTRTGTRKSAI
jgi:hypothetical protein